MSSLRDTISRLQSPVGPIIRIWNERMVMGHDSSVLHHQTKPEVASLTSLAFSATVHRLTGCAIGEVVGSHRHIFRVGNMATVALSAMLAFMFGYLLTLKPL
jgi:hypothetical protein